MSDQKYRQRGYRDGDREERPRSSPQGPPPPKQDGPRGRGLGSPGETVFRCNACGAKQAGADEVAADAVCKACGAALHSCSNCIHFDTSQRWECRQNEHIPARVAKKTAANACPLWTAKTVQEFAKDRDKPADPRAAFEALFK